MKKYIAGISIGCLFFCLSFCPMISAQNSQEMQDLKEQVRRLEQRVSALEALVKTLTAAKSTESNTAKLQTKARERMVKDREVYNEQQLREIETLYQVANKSWNSPEAKACLEKLTQTYTKANRTGCAVLYLAQMSQGETQEKLLKEAVEKYSDCWYGDGVQVGAYARFYLIQYYNQAQKTQEADKLIRELQEKYPDAIDHKGQPLMNALKK